LRILLVDDDPALRKLLATTFEVADVDVLEAENAEAARRHIRRGHPSVIVLDVNMPGTTGLELCRELKDDAKTSGIPIVLLTGADGGTAPAAKEAGADAIVRKPFSPLELLATVQRVTEGLRPAPSRVEQVRIAAEQHANPEPGKCMQCPKV